MGEMKLEELVISAQKMNASDGVYEVYLRVLPFCVKISKPFVNVRVLETEEIESIAFLAVEQAVRKYDAERNASFLTVLKWFLLSELRRMTNSNGSLKVGINTQEDIRKLINAKRNFPDADEYDLCADLHWSYKKLETVEKAAEQFIKPLAYLNKPILNDDGQETELQDLLADETAEFEERVLDKIMASEIAEEIQSTLRNIPKTEAEILRMHHMDGMTFDEISKLLGKPKSTCHVIEKRARGNFLKQLQTKNLYKGSTATYFRQSNTSSPEAVVMNADFDGSITKYITNKRTNNNGTIRKIGNS